jgi:hypothetical protein
MAGNILSKEAASLATIGTTGASLATGSAVLVGQLDARAGGALADLFIALFSLTAQWATITGIAAGTTIADLYLVPVIDGASSPDVDLTAGASYIPYTMRAGSFVASKVPTANTNALFSSLPVDLFPTLYNVYILNRSGQTIATGAVLKAMGAAAQYT